MKITKEQFADKLVKLFPEKKQALAQHYEDFLDPTDAFTDFACENLDGKQGYLDLIHNLHSADKTA